MHTIGLIEHFMTEDHRRLEGLLDAAQVSVETFDQEMYAQFRHDLLRHIGMEEKVLFRFARARRRGEPLAIAAQLHSDHGEIARLLVPSPSAQLVTALKALLARHDTLEEGPGGLYATCDALGGDESAAVLAQLHAQPRVPLAKHYDGPAHKRY
jgi:hypothetical protein